MAKNKNKSFSRGAQFLLIAGILLILGAVLLLGETPESGTITNIVEDPGVVTNVELVGEAEMNDQVTVIDEEEIMVENSGVVEGDIMKGDATVLVRQYFNAYNNNEFGIACDILADSKCNAKNAGDVNRFGQEFKKMTAGYENIIFWMANDAEEFHSDVVCVEYDYTYANDPSPLAIHETMSFYVQDGKITSRVCEAKTADDKSIGCPILSKRDFCL